MQALIADVFYDEFMATKSKPVDLKALRQAAGLSQHELARQIGQRQSNIRYWETSGNLPRSDVLAPMARALGVTVEELLGENGQNRQPLAGGKLGRTFQRVSKLPRRRQQKILEVVEALLAQQSK